METKKPTYHYDTHGHLLYDGDVVTAKGKRAKIFWDDEHKQWLLDFGKKFASLNLYPSRELVFIGRNGNA